MKGRRQEPNTLGSPARSAASRVEGQLLGQAVSTRAAQQTRARPVGAQVAALLRPLAAKQKGGGDFVSMELLSAWPEIIGPRLAGLCLPVRLKTAPKGRGKAGSKEGATLEVLADPAVAIDLDYGQTVIVERVNQFFGYQAVGRLKVVRKAEGYQNAAPVLPQAKSAPAPAALAQAGGMVADVRDDDLRAALEHLGARVLSSS
jgi:hypothetical protein